MSRLLDNFISENSLSIDYTACPIVNIAGDQNLVNELGGIFCRYRKELKTLENCYNLSPVHGRSCLTKSAHGYVHIKGVGWSFGPPYIFSTEKEPELIFGLFDIKYASREIAVSAILSAENITDAKSVANAELVLDWLPRYELPSGFIPSLLYTSLPCPYRIADLAYLDLADRHGLLNIVRKFEYFGASADTKGFIELFLAKLVKASSKLHSIGGVNDHLTYDNVTITGDIIDFEWVYVPGIPCPDGTTDVTLSSRQEKTGLYILEVTLQLSRLLGLEYNLHSIAADAIQYSSCKNLTKLFYRIMVRSN